MVPRGGKRAKRELKKWQERDIAWIIVYIESNEQIMVSWQKQRKKHKRQRNKIQTQTEYRDILSPLRQYDRPIPPLFPPFYTLFIPMSHWMQLMEDRSAKLPRGFSACGVGRKPPRRRQWPSIPFPSSSPHPVSSFPTAAVSHSLHLSDSLDLRERIVRRWWCEVAIERGMRVEEGVRHSFRPQDLEANFREHWPDSFPSRPLPPRSFSSFSFTAHPASLALPLSSFRKRKTTIERKLRKYSRWLTAESSLHEGYEGRNGVKNEKRWRGDKVFDFVFPDSNDLKV